MGWFGWGDAADAHEAAYSGNVGEGSWTHELIAAAAGFEAMKAYNDYEAKNGKPQSNALVKELLAGFAAAEADKLCETYGLGFLDRDKAKGMATEQAHGLFSEKGTGWPEGEEEPKSSSWW